MEPELVTISNESLAKESTKAASRIQKYLFRTPLEKSFFLSKKYGANVYLKMESQQVTGSFKARGSLNKILKYQEEHEDFDDTKFFTASSGNHGLGMTSALNIFGKTGVVYVAENSSKSKQETLKAHGAEVRIFGDDCVLTERESMRASKVENGVYVSPYNDFDIMAGQGTIGVEILEDCQDVDAVFVTVGGGGLIGGLSAYLKHNNPKIQIVGCSPTNSNCMEQSVKAGKQFDIVNEDTLSDGSCGNVDIPSATFPICQRNVDQWVNVSEQEIADAIFMMADVHHKIVEGAAGVAIASYIKVKDQFLGKNVAIVVCGGNLHIATLKSIIDEHV